MQFVQNFPFFSIMLYLAGGVTCCVLKPKASKWVCLAINSLVTAMMVATLLFTLQSGTSYNYYMGHFPAPWGNEIRIGVLESLMSAVMALVMVLTLSGGMAHIFEDCEEDKVNLYFSVVNLLMSSLLALVFTNDIFTAYVFVEINTIASCALVMLKYRSGRALVATTRYLSMSLLGSGLFLLGIIILYALTGQLLMEPAGKAVAELYKTGQYWVPLTVVAAFFSIGLALKSALFPFHTWLPDAHSSATAASSGILSGLVLKGYIFHLIKILLRVLGADYVLSTPVVSVLFIFGILAMVVASVFAAKEKDIKRMLAYSSVAQMGYIFAGIGMGTTAGLVAAYVQIIVHAFTKTMLFCAAGGFMSVSGGSRSYSEIRGAAYRDKLSGIAFCVGAMSMLGIPLFAGFVTKTALTEAAFGAVSWKCWVAIAAIVISTVLNALYYIPAIANLYGKRSDGKYADVKAHTDFLFAAAIIVFIIFNFAIGTHADTLIGMIESGLGMMA